MGANIRVKGPSPFMSNQPQTLDLSLREGVINYVEGMLMADVKRAFETRGSLYPFGVAFATVQGRTTLPRPQVVAANAASIGAKASKRALRALAKHTAAVGTVFVQLTELQPNGSSGTVELVLVQLEHKVWGDLTWTARVKAGRLEPWVGPTAPADSGYAVQATKFLPGRWMH